MYIVSVHVSVFIVASKILLQSFFLRTFHCTVADIADDSSEASLQTDESTRGTQET